MKMNFLISLENVNACHRFCDMIRSATNTDMAEAICIDAEEFVIDHDLRGTAGMWFMAEVNNAFYEKFGYASDSE